MRAKEKSNAGGPECNFTSAGFSAGIKIVELICLASARAVGVTATLNLLIARILFSLKLYEGVLILQKERGL